MRNVKYLLLFFLLTSLLNACQISMIAPEKTPTVSSTQIADLGVITSPVSGSTITGQVVIMGSATTESFQTYQLFYKLETQGDDAYTYVAGDTTPIENGALGIWNTDGMAAGQYRLLLRVVKKDGNYSESYVYNLLVQ